MDHPFMESIALGLAASGIATFRYQFPYMQEGRRRPDPQHLLEATVRSATREANRVFEGLELFAGGKSMGGRMTSNAASHEPLPGVRGLIFLGFPLHPPGKPGDARGTHLAKVNLPMLFLQGTRDNFANLELLQPVVQRLGVTLHIIEGGDHSFKVLKRAGRSPGEVLAELVGAIQAWGRGVLG
jgi:predicted alpha/beta-hydrolase family hydrolase